jgi:hypothetical protein
MENTKTNNIYQKIQKTRNQLQQLDLKKSGKNTYANYSYFELSDFLPWLNKLMDENGIMTKFDLTEGLAFLEVVNTEKPEEVVKFTCPVASAETKGAIAIQQLGSQITYLRRYLLLIAFEISESDTVDNQEPKKEPRQTQTTKAEAKVETKVPMMTPFQKNKIQELLKSKGKTIEDLVGYVKSAWKLDNWETMTLVQANATIKKIEAMPNPEDEVDIEDAEQGIEEMRKEQAK